MTIETSLDTSSMASATAVSYKQENKSNSAKFRPEKVVCIGQVQTGKTTKFNSLALASFNANDAGVLYGFGSPLHRMARKLFPRSGNGCAVDTYFIPVEAPKNALAEIKTIEASVNALSKSFNGYITVRDLPFEAAADITGKIATHYQKNPAQAPRGIDLNSFETSFIPFSLNKGMNAEEVIKALSDVLTEELSLPFIISLSDETPSAMTLTAKWQGEDSAFKINIVDENFEKITAADYGVEFEIKTTQEAAGAALISDEVLNLIDPELGFTRVISQYSSTTNLDKLKENFESFHDPLVAQYVICYTSAEAPECKENKGTYDLEKLTTLGTARREDKVNVQIYGDYGNLKRLKYKERNQLLKAGISNIVKKTTGAYVLYDLVTFYHPQGSNESIYTYDRDITVLANIAYDLMTTFRDEEEWKSIILVAQQDFTTNPAVRKLKAIKAAINARISALGIAGFIADYINAQKYTEIEIDKTNSKRINFNPHFSISGVGNIFDVKNFVSFYYGG